MISKLIEYCTRNLLVVAIFTIFIIFGGIYSLKHIPLDAIPDLFFLMEVDGTIVDYHTGDEKNLYVSPHQFIGQRMMDLLPPEVVSKFQSYLDKILQKEGMITFEYELIMPHGLVHFEARMSYLPEYNQIVLIIRDISEQYKSAEISPVSKIRNTVKIILILNAIIPNRFTDAS